MLPVGLVFGCSTSLVGGYYYYCYCFVYDVCIIKLLVPGAVAAPPFPSITLLSAVFPAVRLPLPAYVLL
jgi:hypothetical protein